MRLLTALCLLAPTAALAQGSGEQPKPKQKQPSGPSYRLSYIFSKLDGKTATYRIQNTLTQSKRVQGSSGKDKERERGKGSAISMTRQTYELAFSKGLRGLGKVNMTPRRIVAKLSENEDDAKERVKVEFDSRTSKQPPPGLEKVVKPLTAMLDKTARMTVDRTGEVRQIRGVKFTQRKAYQSNFHEFPNRRLRVGEGWETLRKQAIPPFGKLHYFTTFRLVEVIPAKGSERERRKISAKIMVTYEGVGPQANTRLRISRQSGSGSLVFDDRGLLLEEKLHSEIEYEIKSVSGTEVHTVKSETVRWLSGLKDTKAK